MQKKLLNNRGAIELLIHSFYVRVKKDELLGPIFNNAENFSWETHIPIMIDFWESLLLDTNSYRGNAMQKHMDLHKRNRLTGEHFSRWKKLFYETLDELFEGPGVTEAHKRVESIGGLMQYKLNEMKNTS